MLQRSHHVTDLTQEIFGGNERLSWSGDKTDTQRGQRKRGRETETQTDRETDRVREQGQSVMAGIF